MFWRSKPQEKDTVEVYDGTAPKPALRAYCCMRCGQFMIVPLDFKWNQKRCEEQTECDNCGHGPLTTLAVSDVDGDMEASDSEHFLIELLRQLQWGRQKQAEFVIANRRKFRDGDKVKTKADYKWSPFTGQIDHASLHIGEYQISYTVTGNGESHNCKEEDIELV